MLLGLLLLAFGFTTFPGIALQPEIFFYMHQETVRKGCFYKPEGNGPFPVMIYNQATPRPSIDLGTPAPFLSLAKFYVSNGYILFLPGRPNLGEATGAPPSETKKEVDALTDEQLLAALAKQSDHIACAVEGLKMQAVVDANRMYMSGHSIGGVQTVLLVERDLGMRGYVAFSPGAKLWDSNPKLQSAMIKAVENQKAPLFLIQPQNDFGFGPSITLAPMLKLQRDENRSRIYSPYGKSQAEGHSFAINAPEVWGNDVLEFMTLCNSTAQ